MIILFPSLKAFSFPWPSSQPSVRHSKPFQPDCNAVLLFHFSCSSPFPRLCSPAHNHPSHPALTGESLRRGPGPHCRGCPSWPLSTPGNSAPMSHPLWSLPRFLWGDDCFLPWAPVAFGPDLYCSYCSICSMITPNSGRTHPLTIVVCELIKSRAVFLRFIHIYILPSAKHIVTAQCVFVNWIKFILFHLGIGLKTWF